METNLPPLTDITLSCSPPPKHDIVRRLDSSALEKVDFALLGSSKDDIRYAIPSLLTNATVKELHLPLDRLDGASAKCILMMLERDDVGPPIEEVHLSNFPRCEAAERTGDEICCQEFIDIISLLPRRTKIKRLVVADTRLAYPEVSATATNLYDAKMLRSLVLRGCGIDYRGTTKIACALASNDSLESLDLSNNPLGNKGVSALVVALEINGNIRKLKLSGVHIGIDGGKAVASILANNSVLEVLDLSRNALGDLGVSKIAVALKSNNALRQLSVRHNSFSDVGAMCLRLSVYNDKALQFVIDSNHKIRYLNIKNNDVSTQNEAIIQTLLNMNLKQSENEAIRSKVAFFLETKPHCSRLHEMDLQLVPYLLSSFSTIGSVNSLYFLIKNSNIPSLYQPDFCQPEATDETTERSNDEESMIDIQDAVL